MKMSSYFVPNMNSSSLYYTDFLFLSQGFDYPKDTKNYLTELIVYDSCFP